MHVRWGDLSRSSRRRATSGGAAGILIMLTVSASAGTAAASPASGLAPHGSGGKGTISAKAGSGHRPAVRLGVSRGAQDASGALSTVSSVVVHGGYTSAGIGMRNLGYGTISITGVPVGATVVSATLLWDVLGDTADPTFAQGTFNGSQITGTAWATGGDPCWGNSANFSYEADVTSLVTGNGSYDLSGFASGETDGADPWNVGTVAPMLEGASLVVVYQLASMPQAVIQIAAGATETDSLAEADATMNGFTVAPSSSVTTTYIVADGQETGNQAGFDGNTLAVDFPGGDPQAVPNYSQGNLWDTVTTDVRSLVSPGDTSASLSVTGNNDCIVWVGQVLAVSTPRTGRCGNTVYIVATGSDQHFKSETDLSVSPQLRALYIAMKSTAAGKFIGVRVLNYPATSVKELVAGLSKVRGFNEADYLVNLTKKLAANINAYLAGKDQGVAALWSQYLNVRASCPPATKIVLGGYSQGSMVVHEFLDELAATGDSSGQAAILGSVLLADPERVKHSNVLELSDAPYRSYGVCGLVSLFVDCAAPNALTDVQPPFLKTAINVCRVDDPVCDTSQLVNHLLELPVPKALALIKSIIAIHESYTSLAATKTAGKLIGRRIAHD
jgi:hypothetical protein